MLLSCADLGWRVRQVVTIVPQVVSRSELQPINSQQLYTPVQSIDTIPEGGRSSWDYD